MSIIAPFEELHIRRVRLTSADEAAEAVTTVGEVIAGIEKAVGEV